MRFILSISLFVPVDKPDRIQQENAPKQIATKTTFADRNTKTLNIRNPYSIQFQPKFLHTLKDIPIRFERPKLDLAVFSDTDIDRIMTACDSPSPSPMPPKCDDIFVVPPLQFDDMNWQEVTQEKRIVAQTDDYDLPPLMELDEEVSDYYF